MDKLKLDKLNNKKIVRDPAFWRKLEGNQMIMFDLIDELIL